MQITVEEKDGVHVVRLIGPVITVDDCEQVWQMLRSHLLQNRLLFVLDMTNCPQISHEVLRDWQYTVIRRIYDRHGGQTVLLNPPANYSKFLIRVSGNGMLQRFYDEAQAIAHFAPVQR
jgi:hypothetical protein